MCTYAGTRPVYFGIPTNEHKPNSLNDLTGSYIFAQRSDGGYSNGWTIYTFISGC